MCGICGMFDTKNGNRISVDVIKKMTSVLQHRGPDAMDCYIKPNIALGFTRLSIIDLANGMQPLSNEDNSIILVCNGEIYNYLELKKDLILKGHRFKTNCDIEVIIHLYEEYDTDFLNLLNGQFSFALYDFKKNQMLCARDYAGIAPFFYCQIDGMFLFASEIKSILKHPAVKKEINLTGLDQIMSFPGMISPTTLFKDINSLEAGHYLVIKDSKIRNIEYWDLVYPLEDEYEYKYSENYYIEKLDELFTKAVKYRLQADVPIGFYISGGLDSSIIAAKINQINPNIKRHSFSIDFTNKNMSESKYQRIMAKNVGSSHHEKLFLFSDIYKRLSKVVYHSESALRETYNTASLALSELVREQNIKIILTGEGADELFGGYVGYRFDKLRQQSRSNTMEMSLENKMQKKLWGDEGFIYEKNHHSYEKVKRKLYSKDINDIYGEIDCTNHFVVNKDRLKGRSIFNKRSYIDFKLRMCDHLLSDHGDRMAYANSIEARYPFLDKDVIEFARIIPSELKLKMYNEKYILKKVAEKIVPKEIIQRPKFAFVAPGSSELLKQDIEFINDLLSYDRIKAQGYFNPDTIEQLKKQYTQPDFKLNVPYENDLLVIAITFGLLLEQFDMPSLK